MAETTIDIRPTDLAAAVGVTVPYASQLLKLDRKPSDQLAIRIYRVLGVKMGAIIGATDEDIDALERLKGAA